MGVRSSGVAISQRSDAVFLLQGQLHRSHSSKSIGRRVRTHYTLKHANRKVLLAMRREVHYAEGLVSTTRPRMVLRWQRLWRRIHFSLSVQGWIAFKAFPGGQ